MVGGWAGGLTISRWALEQGLQEGSAEPTLLICHFLPTSLPPLPWVSAFALCSLHALSSCGAFCLVSLPSSSCAWASPLAFPTCQKVAPSRASLLWLYHATKDITISVSLVRGGACCLRDSFRSGIWAEEGKGIIWFCRSCQCLVLSSDDRGVRDSVTV